MRWNVQQGHPWAASNLCTKDLGCTYTTVYKPKRLRGVNKICIRFCGEYHYAVLVLVVSLYPWGFHMKLITRDRETSNKALNAINQLHLIPFLMAFLDSKSREKLAITTVTAAGEPKYHPKGSHYTWPDTQLSVCTFWQRKMTWPPMKSAWIQLI